MRGIFATATTSMVIACAVFAACGGSDDSNGSNPTNDSGSDGTSLSDGSSSGSDGGGGDGSGDSGPILPGPATITVSSRQTGSPVAGAHVVFYTADGTAQPTMTTGADGTATTTVDEGWSVTASGTALLGKINFTFVTTFMALEPGDNLAASVDTVVAATTPGTMTVTAGTYAGASFYAMSIGCGTFYTASTPSHVFNVPASCMPGGKVTAVVYAFAQNAGMIGYAQETDVSFSDGATITGFTYAATTQAALTLTGTAPASAIEEDLSLDLMAGGRSFGSDMPAIKHMSDAGTAAPTTVGIPTGSFITADAYRGGFLYAGNSLQQKVAQGTFADGFSLDVGALPPRIHDDVVTADGSGNASLTFTADGAVTGLDGMETQLYWTAPDVTPTVTDAYYWTIVSPPNASTNFPKLSTDLVTLLPPASTALNYVYVRKGTPFGSYAAFKKNDLAYGFDLPTSPAAYSYVQSGITPP